MDLFKNIISAILCCKILIISSYVFAAGISNYPEFLNSDFWIKHNSGGDKVVLSDQEIKDLNIKIREASPTVVDLENFPQEVNGEFVRAKVQNFDVLEEDLYLNGNKVSDNYKNSLRKLTSTDKINNVVVPKYGIVLRRSSLRTLPTAQPLFYYANDKDFDALQETMLEPCEPVLILHTSENGFLYFVQAANYCGWISKYNIGITDRIEWMEYVKPQHFLIVTAPVYTIDVWGEKIVYQMGAKIPYLNKNENGYFVNCPARNKEGKLVKVDKNIPLQAMVSDGYLLYTRNNLLKQAFLFHGMPYGWGGLQDSVDCSGLLYCIYRTVGIILPRNADEQMATYGTHINFTGVAIGETRLNAIKNISPGTPIFMDGHCLFYVGIANNTPYAIHALGSYWGGGKRIPVMQVVLSDLSLQRVNGNSFADEILEAVEYK